MSNAAIVRSVHADLVRVGDALARIAAAPRDAAHQLAHVRGHLDQAVFHLVIAARHGVDPVVDVVAA